MVQEAGGDADEGADGGSPAVGAGELFDADIDRELLGNEEEHTADDGGDADISESDTAVGSEEHRGGVEHHDEDEQEHAQQVEHLGRLLQRVHLIRLEHGQLAGVGRNAFNEGAWQADAVRDFDEQLAQVDDERSARGGQQCTVVTVRHFHERGMCGSVHGGPQRPEPFAFERPIRQADSVGLQGRCDRSGELCGRAGQQGFESAGHIDRPEQLSDQELRQRPTNVVVGQHLVTDRHPLVGVECLTVDPAAQGGAHPDDRGEHDHHP